MSRTKADYTRCPDCGRKTVVLNLRPNGQDYYGCTWRKNKIDSGCTFAFFSETRDYAVDRENCNRWRVANGMAPGERPED